MKKGKKPETNPVLDVADSLLGDLSAAVAKLRAIEQEVERQIEYVREEYAENMKYYRGQIRMFEGDLTAIMKTNRDLLFSGQDKIDLLHGLLLYARGPHVVIPKDALGRIKEQGWIEGIRVAESVDRGIVTGWPDEMLAVIGAKRTMKEMYSYELKN